MDEDFTMLRAERRSFFCPNELWERLLKKTNNCISVSQFIRMAIEEKLEKENGVPKEVFTYLASSVETGVKTPILV